MSTVDTQTPGTTPRWTQVDPEYWSAYREATQVMDRTPAALTDDMIQTIAFTDPMRATQARARRAKALEVPVPKPATPAAPKAALKARRWTADAQEAIFEKAVEHGFNTLVPEERQAICQPAPLYRAQFADRHIAQLQAFVKDMNTRNQERNRRLDELEMRCAELERRPRGLSYEGVWREGATYASSDCVTDHGSLWIAERQTTTRPGDLNSGWRLAVKKGTL